MKKKVLAVILASIMLVNTAVPAMAETQNAEILVDEENVDIQEEESERIDNGSEENESEEIKKEESEEKLEEKDDTEGRSETEEDAEAQESRMEDAEEIEISEDDDAQEGTELEDLKKEQKEEITNKRESEKNVFEVGDSFEKDGITYTVNEGVQSCTITACDAEIKGSIKIPAKVNGMNVTKIGNQGFYRCEGITAVELPAGIESIGTEAFRFCESLCSITLPESITEIKNEAFGYCSSLEAVQIPNRVTTIENGVFGSCTNLKSILLPDGITTIELSAFQSCWSLEEITLPAELEEIGAYAFKGCTKLASVSLKNKVTKVGYDAFSNCANLKKVIYNGDEKRRKKIDISFGNEYFEGASWEYQNSDYEKTGLIYRVNQDGKSCTITGYYENVSDILQIPQTVDGYIVTSIARKAFLSSDFLEIRLPDGLEMIGGEAFYGSKIEKVEIPDSVKTIEYCAFEACENLKSVKLSSNLEVISNGLFYGDIKLEGIIIPESVRKIGGLAFVGCKSLKEISIPDSVSELELQAFMECSELKKVKLPKNLLKINEAEFLNCEKLTEIIFPEKLRWIGLSAFMNTGITSLVLPDSVETIDSWAFNGTPIRELNLPTNLKKICSFSDCSYLEKVVMGENLKEIGENCFFGCNHLMTVIIKGNTSEIEKGIFEGANRLTNLYIPKTVSKIKMQAFRCRSDETVACIKNIYYEGTKEEADKIEIEDNQFIADVVWHYNCADVPEGEEWSYEVNEDGTTCTITGYGEGYVGIDAKDIVFPEKLDGYIVTDIGENAFKSNETVESVTFPETIKNIKSNAFSMCPNLKTVTILSIETAVWARAFWEYTENIKDVYYAGSMKDRKEKIDSWSAGYFFDSATWHYGIEDPKTFQYEYTINEDRKTCTITKAEEYIYGDIIVPNEIDGYMVTAIGNGAFRNNNSLTKVELPKNLKTIGNYAFAYCERIKEITLPETICEIGESAFETTAISSVKIPKKVTSIKGSTFENCHELVNVEFSENINVIEDDAFRYCDNLESISLPENLQKIGDHAFIGTKCKVIKIPQWVKEIGTDAFSRCRAIYLPKNIEKIGKNAFYSILGGEDESKIKLDIYYGGTENEKENIAIGEQNISGIVWHYSAEEIPKYYENDNDFDYVVNEDGITCTVTEVVKEVSGKMVIPQQLDGYQVTGIGENFARAQSSIREVEIPEGVIAIDKQAFRDCFNLKIVVLPKSIQKIGENAFTITSLSVVKYKGSKSDREKINFISPVTEEIQEATWIYGTRDDTIPELGGWQKKDGKWYYVDPDTGNKVANTKKEISGNMYWFDSTGAMQTGWIRSVDDEGKVIWMYGEKNNGKLLKASWLKIGDKWYYFKNYEMVTGIVTISGTSHWFKANGEWIKELENNETGWRFVGSDWYYLERGELAASGIKNIHGKKYMFDDEGKMYYDCEKTVQTEKGPVTYYFGKSGVAYTGQWRLVSGQKWKYYDSEGVEARSCWKKMKNAWYYFDNSGKMLTDWQMIKNVWYYFENSGKMAVGWQKVDKHWYYLDANGARTAGWRYINKKWYYMAKDGIMQTGWQKINNVWYYFKVNGEMTTGWQKLNNVWYYLQSSGKMATGWQKIGESWYYFYADGKMASNSWIGKWYVNDSGAWTKSK